MTAHTPDRTIVYTDEHHVACDGGGVTGHPLTYYVLDHGGRTECRYCDRVFVWRSGQRKPNT